MRVHELAKELNLSSRELLEKLKALKIEAKSHMSTLDEEAVGRRLPRHVLEQQERRLVRPMEVVQEEHQRPGRAGRRAAHELGDAVEQAQAGPCSVESE